VKSKLTLVTEPRAFFYEQITQALQDLRVSAIPETEFYLVNLLNQFVSAENLYIRDADGHMREEPLAMMLKEAIETPTSSNQRLMFRHVGDVSLYTAGYFQESLHRKSAPIDYYITLGGQAYQQVARREDLGAKQKMFEELSTKFSAFVDVLSRVGEKTNFLAQNERDLLRVYEIWLKTKSERAAKALQEAGITPTDGTETED
jgi:hypothetical protein